MSPGNNTWLSWSHSSQLDKCLRTFILGHGPSCNGATRPSRDVIPEREGTPAPRHAAPHPTFAVLLFGNPDSNEDWPKSSEISCGLSCLRNFGKVLSRSQTTVTDSPHHKYAATRSGGSVAWESSQSTSWKHGPACLCIYGTEIEIRSVKTKWWAIKGITKYTMKFYIAPLMRPCYTLDRIPVTT